MKLRFPPTRYRVVRDWDLGYEAQFRPWWSLVWMQCDLYDIGKGTNTSNTLEAARRVCAEHNTRRRRLGQVVAQFSARELEAQQ